MGHRRRRNRPAPGRHRRVRLHRRADSVQDGSTDAAFALSFHATTNRWRLSVGVDGVDSKAVPAVGVWTHLAGVYDATIGQFRLYVNGLRDATGDRTGAWTGGSGSVHMGRRKSGGAWGSYWPGGVDDVRVLDRAATASEIAVLGRHPDLPADRAGIRPRLAHSNLCASEQTGSTSGLLYQSSCASVLPAQSLLGAGDGTYWMTLYHPSFGAGCMGASSQVEDDFCGPDKGQRLWAEAVAGTAHGFRFRFVHSGQCLGVAGGSTAAGTQLVPLACTTSTPGQVFLLDRVTPAPVTFGLPELHQSIDDGTTSGLAIPVTGIAGAAPSNLAVTISITHTYIGDLVVSLEAPDGTRYVLHNRSGGSTDNLRNVYTVNASNETASGTWWILVEDAAAGDEGTIDSLAISFP